MNDYIKGRIELENLAITEQCHGGDLDESYANGLWDWAYQITKEIKDEALKEEMQGEVYYALQELFNTFYKP